MTIHRQPNASANAPAARVVRKAPWSVERSDMRSVSSVPIVGAAVQMQEQVGLRFVDRYRGEGCGAQIGRCDEVPQGRIVSADRNEVIRSLVGCDLPAQRGLALH